MTSNQRTTLIERAGAEIVLPDYRSVADAIRNAFRDKPSDTFIIRQARAFGQLHLNRALFPTRGGSIDGRRSEVASMVDNWVDLAIPLRPGTATPRRSLGALLDDMAAAEVEADRLRLGSKPVDADAVHHAWTALGELANRWTDLVEQITNSQPWRWFVDEAQNY
ncbi:hypothetical protein [Nocardia amamiensis]|uniref:hypothetical protein n=1 Tax=Nocardia amamiensis TaxID=404578 RepID=UPI0033EB6B90